MSLIDTSAKRWDRTPKHVISTTIHRVRPKAGIADAIERCRTVQLAVYDTTLEHLRRHPREPWIATGTEPGESVLKWLIRRPRSTAALSLSMATSSATPTSASTAGSTAPTTRRWLASLMTDAPASTSSRDPAERETSSAMQRGGGEISLPSWARYAEGLCEFRQGSRALTRMRHRFPISHRVSCE